MQDFGDNSIALKQIGTEAAGWENTLKKKNLVWVHIAWYIGFKLTSKETH